MARRLTFPHDLPISTLSLWSLQLFFDRPNNVIKRMQRYFLQYFLKQISNGHISNSVAHTPNSLAWILLMTFSLPYSNVDTKTVLYRPTCNFICSVIFFLRTIPPEICIMYRTRYKRHRKQLVFVIRNVYR